MLTPPPKMSLLRNHPLAQHGMQPAFLPPSWRTKAGLHRGMTSCHQASLGSASQQLPSASQSPTHNTRHI